MIGILGQLVFGGVAGAFVGGKVASKVMQQFDEWFRLSLSLSGTALVTFLGILGGAGLAALKSTDGNVALSMAIAFCTACVATGAAIYGVWRYSPLTKGIPIMAPVNVVEREMQGGFTIMEPSKPTGGKP